MRLKTKRVYDEPSHNDGYRILVDRVWPRGVSKDSADLDDWMKELAPSSELRRWFGHDSERWEGFKERYAAELDARPEQVEALRHRAREKTTTLLFGAKDEVHNNAVALKDYLERRA